MDGVGIVGNGMVGSALGNVFGIKKRFDLHDDRCTANLEEIGNCRIVFICIPTPIDEYGKYQVNDIISIVRQIEDYGHAPIYVIRSTVFPGFARHLMELTGIERVISNPEFLSEDTAEKDVKNPPFVLLGGQPGVFMDEVKALYNSRLKSVNFILTDNTTAEMCKSSLNSFFSTKTIFSNQIFDACQQLGANYEKVKEVLEKHPFGMKNHNVIWYKGRRGVGGHCLPKDTTALATLTNSELLKKIMEINQTYISQTQNA